MIKDGRLKNFQISFLALVLGIVGFALVVQKMTGILNLNEAIFPVILNISLLVSTVVIGLYLLKAIFYSKEFLADFNHPIRVNFFPLLAKILLIYSVMYYPINAQISKHVWIAGTAVQLLFSLIIIPRWLFGKYDIKQINPSWFIPIVGSVMVPIAGIHHFHHDLSWFFFSSGLIWWLLLFVMVIYRIIFHPPVKEKFLPTFYILFAPPAIAFISSVKLLGEVTAFGKILYFISLFMFIIIFSRSYMFRKIKFYLSWWAYSFPIVALTVATILMFHETHLSFYKHLSLGLSGFLVLMVGYLIFRTGKAISKKDLCIEE